MRASPILAFPHRVTDTTAAEPPERSARENAETVRAALVGTRFADVRWFESTGSTNADVLDLARSGGPEGIVIVADHQDAGRGRRGRTWQAPRRSSLMASILLRPPASVAGLATMTTALAASRAVEDVCGVVSRLKWPNDLVWPGDGAGADRKLAGILAEADWPAGSAISDGWREPRPADRVTVVVGIGLNVAWGDRVPEDLVDRAIALDHILGSDTAPPERADLLIALLGHLDRIDTDLRTDQGPDRLIEAWKHRSATLGRRVRVDLGTHDLVGTAVDLTDRGHLVVDTLEGERREVTVGDVVHLRDR